MKVRPNLFSLPGNLDSLLAALIGFFLIQIFSRHSGIGVSPDSVTYISAARNMIAGNGFISFEHLPVIDFPFGYPFFLTVVSFFTRLDPLHYGPVLNGFLFAVLLYVGGSMMNVFEKTSGWYKRIVLCCILFSPALQELYSFLWSETIFLLLILLFIISMSNYLSQMTWKWLLISTGISVCVCLTRYAGVFLMITGMIVIFFHVVLPWRKRIVHCLVFGSLSISLLLINVIRNFSLTGLATGPRSKSDTGIIKIVEYFGDVISDWLLIGKRPGLSIVLAGMVMFVFILTIFFRYRKKSVYGMEYMVAVTGLTYSVFMIFSSTLTRYEQFTSRLLAPMFIPLLWSLSYWIPGFIASRSYRMKWIYTGPLLFAAAWFLNVEMAADYEFYDGVKDAGIWGYQEDPFVQSGIVRFVEQYKSSFDPRYPIYSNAGDAVYFITGLPARQLPFTAFSDRVQTYYSAKNSYLVWFGDLDNPEMPGLPSILQNKNLELIKQLPDGAVYISK